MERILTLIAILLLISAPVLLAQEIDYCEGNFDYDQDVDGTDATIFKDDFGRSTFDDPCPPYNPAPSLVPKTGQLISYATSDDGDLENGVTSPNPRFTDNGDGTVTDNLTGLIWLKNANCFGIRTWNEALSDSNGLADGSCGLTDGSNAGDWRLPNYRELFSLMDAANHVWALPTGHPFTNMHSFYYWSSTTNASAPDSAWCVYLWYGLVHDRNKSNTHPVWPVLGGH